MPALSGQSKTDKHPFSGQIIKSCAASSRPLGKRERASERARERPGYFIVLRTRFLENMAMHGL